MPMFANNAEKSNALDLALDAGALFDVHTEPLQAGGYVPTIEDGVYAGQPEKIVHYRTLADGSVKVLNVAHPSHPSSNYLQVLETAEALFPDSTTKVMSLDGGSRLMFTQEIGSEVDLGGGDVVRPNLMWTASLDSSWSTGAHGLADRWFCTNQMPLAKCHLKVRRTLNHDINLGSKSAILATVMGRFNEFVSDVSTLRHISVTARQFSEMLGALIPAPEADAHGKTVNAYEKRVAAVKYYFGEESDGPAAGTAWAAYNAIQSAELHTFTEGKNQDRKQAEIVSEDKHQNMSRAAGPLLLALA